jgi:nicotinate-nucleotide--dimethylbenzimidazole phosphoribosyltransferase
MASHEIKKCECCGTLFECKVGNILECQCYAVQLTEAEKAYISEKRYNDCLCAACLHTLKQEFNNNSKMEITAALAQKINFKTKPLGALGALEAVALQVGTIQNSLSPVISKPHIVVFAGDHGIAATGLVNPYPQAVTAQMVLNFVQGGAAINVFCRLHDIALTVVDAGVNYDFEKMAGIVDVKIAMGTADYLQGDAMTGEQLAAAMQKGAEIVAGIYAQGCNTIAFGEMGIGNTSSAALLMHQLCGLPLEQCVGRGTGADDAQYRVKLKILQSVAEIHGLSKDDMLADRLLQKTGGFEIAMMAGAYEKAFELNMLIVVDGFIATAALLAAHQQHHGILSNCIFAHTSGEQGHEKMLQYLGAKPLLNLGMRLGEGTGTAMAMPIIRSAVAFLNEMASFESAGVDNKA